MSRERVPIDPHVFVEPRHPVVQGVHSWQFGELGARFALGWVEVLALDAALRTRCSQPNGTMGPKVHESQTAKLLIRMEAGDETAAAELLPVVYDEMRRIAKRLMVDERRNHTLQTTALIHEAWMRLGDSSRYEDRRHFLRVAARAMRNVLVDHARAKRATKRGGGKPTAPLDDALAAYEAKDIDVVALNEALEKLGESDPELLRIVELRLFGGLTMKETGEVVGKTLRQVDRAWTFARGWLRRELEGGER